MLGQEVAQITKKDFQVGDHNVEFIAENLSSGAYIYTFEAKGINGSIFKSTKKMLLLR